MIQTSLDVPFLYVDLDTSDLRCLFVNSDIFRLSVFVYWFRHQIFYVYRLIQTLSDFPCLYVDVDVFSFHMLIYFLWTFSDINVDIFEEQPTSDCWHFHTTWSGDGTCLLSSSCWEGLASDAGLPFFKCQRCTHQMCLWLLYIW